MIGDNEKKDRQAGRDKKLPHAVVVVDVVPTDEWESAAIIEEGMIELNTRALNAGMVILNTIVNTQSYVLPGEGKHVPHVVYIVVAQWMEREKLESMQRQQSLMGGPSGAGPNGAGPRGVR